MAHQQWEPTRGKKKYLLSLLYQIEGGKVWGMQADGFLKYPFSKQGNSERGRGDRNMNCAINI